MTSDLGGFFSRRKTASLYRNGIEFYSLGFYALQCCCLLAASAVFNYYFSDDAARFEDLKDDVDIALPFNDAIRKRHQYWTAQSQFGRKN